MVCILSKQAPFHLSALRDCAPDGTCRHGTQHACRNSCAHVCAPQAAKRRTPHMARRTLQRAAHARHFCLRGIRCAFLPAPCARSAHALYATAGPAERQRAPDAALSLSGNTSTQDTQCAFPPAPCVPASPRHAYPPARAMRTRRPAPCVPAPHPALLSAHPALLSARPALRPLCTEKNKGSPQ